MVLSNKKLKQKLRAEATRQQGSPLPTPDESKVIKKREKRRQRRPQLESATAQQAASADDTPAIDQAELDIYHRCLENLISDRDSNPSSRQGPEDEAPVSLHSSRNQGHGAAVDRPTVVSSEANVLNANNPSLPTLDAKSRKRKKALNLNAGIEKQEEKVAVHSAEDQDSSESRTVYVGGIPYYSSEDDIRSFFSDCGTISEVNLKTFRDSGKFCGIALLTFKTMGAAQRALALDGSSMGERFLKIQPSEAKPKPKEPTNKEAHTTPPRKTDGYLRAYIGNLSWSVTEEHIRDFFKGCRIEKVRFSEDKLTRDFRGFGHVDFADDESLELALKKDQQILLERSMKIAYAVPNIPKKKTGSAAKDRKDISCHTCGEKGHVTSRCPYMGRG